MRKLKTSEAFTGVLIVLLSAFLFSAKAVLAKLVYRQVDMPVITLLVLRMFFSLPFYLAMLGWQWGLYRRQLEVHRRSAFLPSHLLWPTMLIGCLGYFISSVLDFGGLKYISAGLERVILFSYPTLVVVFGALFFKTKVLKHQVWALLLSYLGIGIAFWADLQHNTGAEVWKGALLIFGCAITFATYVLLSGRWIPRLGVGLFTSVAMLAATAAIFLTYLILSGDMKPLLNYSGKVYGLMVLMAVFTTVVPSFLVSLGIQKIGSSNVAIVSSIGPMITIAQAYYLLGEPFGWTQAIGTLLVVLGVWWVSKKAEAVKH